MINRVIKHILAIGFLTGLHCNLVAQSIVLDQAKANPELFVGEVDDWIRNDRLDRINDTILLSYIIANTELGDLNQAEFWSDSLASKYLKDSIQSGFEVRLARNIAVVKKTNLGFEDALDLYLKVLAYFLEKNNRVETANSYIDLAEYHRSVYNHEIGLGFIEKARQTLQDTLFPKKLYARLLNRQAALINESQEDKTEVIALSKEALKIAEELDDKDMIATISNELGYTSQNSDAIPYYNKAIELWTELGNQYSVNHTKINLARSYSNTNRSEEGIKLVLDVLEEATKNDWFLLKWWSHEYLAVSYAQVGDWDKSALHVKDALDAAAKHEESRHKRNLSVAMARSEASLMKYELKAQKAAFEKVNAELENERLRRNFVLIMALVVSITLLAMLIFYRRNKRANKDLSNQKKITELMNKELKENLQQRETLIQEVHHRVKNNLQIISSMLNMQINNEEDQHTINSIQNAQQRVHSIALIHERLYRHDSLVRINFKEYLDELVQYLNTMVVAEKLKLTFNIETMDVAFKLNTAIPLGLIINELVTNAIKYAFEGRQKGEIDIELMFADDQNYLLIIKDNGIGIDINKSKEGSSRGIGTRLVSLLVRQLRAEYSVESENGTKYSIKFPFN